MGTWRPDEAAVARLHRRARADRWALAPRSFAAWLERAARHAFPVDPPRRRQLERYLTSLHLEDLALACACAEGLDAAWDHFVREYRPVLYRAADAIDPAGGAREAADSLYGELYGLRAPEGERRSLFRYFHGRSALATWLRAVLAQRHVDRVRSLARLEPLPDDESFVLGAPAAPPATGTWSRHVAVLRRAMRGAVAALPARDRLRLACYHAQGLTLAQIGRTLGEHEATVSRHLARTRRMIRESVEAKLRDAEGMSPVEIDECFAAVLEDPGPLDVADLIGPEAGRKELVPERSE
jgi:RNA polymerase sigma-70 factor (ECF subfamily)